MKKPKYVAILADEDHLPITNFNQLRSWRTDMGFFIRQPDGTLKKCGYGRLEVENRREKWAHTESMGLRRGMRRKGHGIHLYLAIIRIAKEIGVTRLYSSKSLNRYSGRMWADKLSKFFTVIHMKSRHNCNCRYCRKTWKQHYIDLRGLHAKTMPR